MARYGAVLMMVGSGVVGMAVVASPAAADPPLRWAETYTWDETVEDAFLTGECGFEVMASSKGRYSETYRFDKAGNLVRVDAHPSYASVLSSAYGSLTTADRGVDKYSLDADGNLQVHGTGIHLKVKGQAYSIGLWRLTFGPEGEVLSQEYHGNFGLTYPYIVPFICEALGPDGG